MQASSSPLPGQEPSLRQHQPGALQSPASVSTLPLLTPSHPTQPHPASSTQGDNITNLFPSGGLWQADEREVGDHLNSPSPIT